MHVGFAEGVGLSDCPREPRCVKFVIHNVESTVDDQRLLKYALLTYLTGRGLSQPFNVTTPVLDHGFSLLYV